jgi:hypothetical protein
MNFKGQYSNKAAKVDVSVDLFQFEEDGVTIIYSPAFDLSGYGNNVDEAKKSWEESVEEFLRYGITKKTLAKDLKRLGWNINEHDVKKRHFRHPELARLITQNNYLQEILNEKTFSKFNENVTLPC